MHKTCTTKSVASCLVFWQDYGKRQESFQAPRPSSSRLLSRIVVLVVLLFLCFALPMCFTRCDFPTEPF